MFAKSTIKLKLINLEIKKKQKNKRKWKFMYDGLMDRSSNLGLLQHAVVRSIERLVLLCQSVVIWGSRLYSRTIWTLLYTLLAYLAIDYLSATWRLRHPLTSWTELMFASEPTPKLVITQQQQKQTETVSNLSFMINEIRISKYFLHSIIRNRLWSQRLLWFYFFNWT